MTRRRFTNFNQFSLFGQEKEPTRFQKKFTATAKDDILVELKLQTYSYIKWSSNFRKMLKQNENFPDVVKNRFEYETLVKELTETVNFYKDHALPELKHMDGYNGRNDLQKLLSNLDVKSRAIGWMGREISNKSGSFVKDVFLHGAGDEKKDAGIVRTYCTIIYHACAMLEDLDNLEIKDAMLLYHQKIEDRKNKPRSSDFMEQDRNLHNAVKSFMACCLIPQTIN